MIQFPRWWLKTRSPFYHESVKRSLTPAIFLDDFFWAWLFGNNASLAIAWISWECTMLSTISDGTKNFLHQVGGMVYDGIVRSVPGCGFLERVWCIGLLYSVRGRYRSCSWHSLRKLTFSINRLSSKKHTELGGNRTYCVGIYHTRRCFQNGCIHQIKSWFADVCGRILRKVYSTSKISTKCQWI
jgi:hypothetical protein